MKTLGTIDGDIEFFRQYFLSQIQLVSGLSERLHKKILYSCILDTLGQGRFPQKTKKPKIVSFINNCSGWKEKSRISLSQLLHHLDDNLPAGNNQNSQLYGYAQRRLSSLSSARVYKSPEVDPDVNELRKIAPEQTEQEKKFINLSRYDNLFNAFRNKLVHSYKEPGHPLEGPSDGNTPRFHMGDSQYGQLIFPVGFFHWLCEKCLDGLCNYLILNRVNPYRDKIYDFGDVWSENENNNISRRLKVRI